MSGRIARRLIELGLTLPKAQPPVATYVPFTHAGNLVVLSGQLPMENGKLAVAGKLGDTVTIEDGQFAARLCLLNLLAHLQTACDGDLDRVRRILRLGGFIACTPGFADHPKVMNGASDLAVDIFGDAGRHARSTVGVPSLPLDAAVEVEALVELN